MSEELKTAKESDKKGESSEQESQPDGGKMAKDDSDSKTVKSEEEGEIEEGEEVASSSEAELKELRDNLK